jgi:hypothetical protein
MFKEIGHPNVSRADWELSRSEFSPFSFSEVINRRKVTYPKWYLPLARGAAIASDYLLDKAGYAPGRQLPSGWEPQEPGVFKRTLGDRSTLRVRQCGIQPLWTVELFHPNGKWVKSDKVLVFLFGSTPVLTRDHVSAAHLADWAFANKLIGSLRWVDAFPLDHKRALAFARQRNGAERRANGEIHRQRRADARLRRQARKVKTA